MATPPDDIDAFIERADAERRAHRPYLAYRLYRHASELAADGVKIFALRRALDVCAEYFAVDADETLDTARRLCELSPTDGRALASLGTGLSIRSRRTFKEQGQKAGLKQAEEAEACLLRATKCCPFDTDAWGVLGGLYKRMAQWAADSKDDASALAHRAAMLDAYKRGMDEGPDPYPTLNYLECRVIAEPKTPIVPAAERAKLERALDVRRRQFARGEDAPWAAFDLARGQHYLEPNVPRFLNDLNVAIDDARRVAKRASDRWMVETAVTSLRDMYNAAVPLDGLEEALLLARAAVVDDGWVAGNWGPLGRPEDFLLKELRAARAELDRLAQQSAAARDEIGRHLKQAEQRWSEEDEARFEKQLKEFERELEPPLKRQARVLWKLFGKEALEWALRSGVALVAPGVGVVTAAVPLIAKYVEQLTNPSE
jgi:hypothetical protein